VKKRLKPRKKPLFLRISPDIWDALARRARASYQTKSEFIEKLLSEIRN
jgi:hypothetical protein